jgi:HemK-related putative methylase
MRAVAEIVAPVGPARPRWARRVVAALARRWLSLRYRVLSRRYDRLALEQVDGVPLIVLPRVFNPVLLRSGAFMARSVSQWAWPSDRERPLVVLDLGTGSGVGAIFAARHGARVVAVDINAEAVRCARINALLNGLEERIEARQGDLFAPVRGQRFDLVLFNPPFYQGQPANELDYAWRGEGVFERFVAGLDAALAPGGQALVVLSSDGHGPELLRLLAAAGFAIRPERRQNLVNEVLTLYELSRPSVSAPAGNG